MDEGRVLSCGRGSTGVTHLTHLRKFKDTVNGLSYGGSIWVRLLVNASRFWADLGNRLLTYSVVNLGAAPKAAPATGLVDLLQASIVRCHLGFGGGQYR